MNWLTTWRAIRFYAW